MSTRQAANASARCGDAQTMAIDESPTRRSPRRWTTAIATSGYCACVFVDDLLDLFLRHRAIGVVEDRLDGVPFVMVADHALEEDVRAVGRPHARAATSAAVSIGRVGR